MPEELLKALEPGGFAHSLVEFGGSGMWALDLQLRGLGETKKQHRATLYVGTTKVADLHLKGQSFALSAHPTLAREANGWVAAWAQWHHDRWFADQWADVDNYLQVVIERIVRAGTYVKEGMVRTCRRPARREDVRVFLSRCPHPHGPALHRYVRARVMALILRHVEAQYPGVKVDGRVKVRREDLPPQCHFHPRIVAQPASSASAALCTSHVRWSCSVGSPTTR